MVCMKMNLEKLTSLKAELDALRPLNALTLNNLERWLEVELTYSSNAIEGNTLTRQETALVIEKGITIGGKPLKDHIEATNHRDALLHIKKMLHQKDISLADILSIHKIILNGIDDGHAGVIRNVPVRISGSPVVLPNYLKVPELMEQFIEGLRINKTHPVQCAMRAHYDFVSIHPFIDGNGRTGRLLMNLILMQCGYPPAIILPKDRLSYLKSLEKAQMGGDIQDYHHFIYKAVLKSLNIYLKAFKNEPMAEQSDTYLLRIGALSKQTNESAPTLRYWTKMGLLDVATTTKSGYQLYDASQIERCRQIRHWQKERYTLEEILIKISE